MSAPTREELEPFVEQGLVSCQKHPTADLWIYNYTKRCAYDRCWSPETLAARGLILDAQSNVVARPFPKFFNLDEPSPEGPLPEGPFAVTEKLDGSLGVFYEGPDGPSIATRGSFVSDQARKATGMLQGRYDAWKPPACTTPLFEIIYPANRIVVDYGQTEALVLLALINNATGADLPIEAARWKGPIAKQYPAADLAPTDVLKTLGIEDGTQEGFVLRFDSDGPAHRVKVKLDEYKRLHRILTGVSSKTIWEALRLNRSLDEVLDRVPDEFNAWVRAEIKRQTDAHAVLLHDTSDAFDALVDQLPAGFDRKQFADAALSPRGDNIEAGWLFMLLDGRDPSEKIWRRLQPEFSTPFKIDDDES